MKKLLLMAALAVAGFANAQKGTILVAGDLGFYTDKSGSVKTNNFHVAPKVGYQFNDHWTVGISGGVATGKTETEVLGIFETPVTVENKHTNISVGPFVRYSQPISELFGFFADLETGYQSRDSSGTTVFGGTPGLDGDGFYASVTPALFINVKKNFGLNVSFGGLGFDTLSLDGGDDSTHFGFNFGQTFNIGISKNF